MKIIIILLLISINVLGLHAGDITGNMEVGTTLVKKEAFAKIIIGYDFKIWKIGNYFYGGWETWMELPDRGLIMTKVLSDIYTIGYRISYKDIYLKFNHSCKHAFDVDDWRSEYLKTDITLGVNF